MPRLRFVSTVQGADTIELQDPIITIGRDPLNVVCIEDPNISKHHVLLIREAKTYKIYDLHSVNTTTVNGNRITASALKDGDIIRIGYLDLTYEIEAVKPATAAPPLVHVASAAPVAPPAPQTATTVVSGTAPEPATAAKPTPGTLRLKPLPRLGPAAAAGSSASPAATSPVPRAATAAVAPAAASSAPAPAPGHRSAVRHPELEAGR